MGINLVFGFSMLLMNLTDADVICFDRDVLVFRSHFCLSAAPPMKPYIGSRTLKRIDFTEEKK